MGIYLIGTSDLYFESDSILRRIGPLSRAPPSRKDPFVGVVVVVLIGLIIGSPSLVILVAITDSVPLSFGLYIMALLLIFWFVTRIHHESRRRRVVRS